MHGQVETSFLEIMMIDLSLERCRMSVKIEAGKGSAGESSERPRYNVGSSEQVWKYSLGQKELPCEREG